MSQPETREPIPVAFQKGQWKPVAYTEKEGGAWIKITDKPPESFSSIKYANGWVFDNALLAANHETCWRRVDRQ